MAYELVGETIKSAISIKLGEIFSGSTRYKENITKPKYPSFWIIQVSENVTPKGVSKSALNNKINRIQLDYLFNIQYRAAENTETISNLRQQLDAIGFKLNTEFIEINLERPTKVKNAYYEIADGVLQFFFNLTVFATPEVSNEAVMRSLDENIYLEEV